MPAFFDSILQFILAVNITYIFGIVTFGAYVWFTFATVYHFIRFGIGVAPKNFALIFLFGSLLLFMITLILYSRIEWDVLLSIPLSPNHVNFN